MISFYATIRYFWQVSLINLGPGPGGFVNPGQYGSPLIWYGGLSISANIGHLTIIQFKNQFILLVHVISMVWCKFSSPCHLAPFTPKFEKSGPNPLKAPYFPIYQCFSEWGSVCWKKILKKWPVESIFTGFDRQEILTSSLSSGFEVSENRDPLYFGESKFVSPKEL